MDFKAAGLLDGLEGDDRRARLRLLKALAEDGFTLDELRDAALENRLVLLPVERVLAGTYTLDEVAERSGLSTDLVKRIRRLEGLPEPEPDQRVFSKEEEKALQMTKQFLDSGFSEDAIGQITRVLGEVMARFSATVTASFAETFLNPGDSEEDVARRFAALAQELTPMLAPVLVATFKSHLQQAVSRGMLGQAELQAGHVQGEQNLAVCFADLVGFTRLGGRIEVQELGTVAGRLAELAAEVNTDPVRLVKTIGDAAMFVSREPARMVGVALSLVEAVEDADMPALRAGIASGPAMQRAGDFYGHSVNLASRVTGIARPGSVLCTEDIRDAAADGFEWSSAGKHRLKGVKEPIRLFRARRPERAADERSKQASTKPRADRPRRRASR